MTHWMCTTCGYYLQGPAPPKRCPSCTQACAFNDVTCYRSECGGIMNIDPLRVSHTLKELKGIPRTDFRPQYKPLPLEGFPLVDFVNGLSEQQKQLVGSLGHIEYYESNTIIFKEGEEASKFYLIEEGQVSVESRLVEGMRFPIHVASLGQTFGWSALVRPYL